MSTTETLTHAMRDQRTVSFVYDDKTRIIEVHAIGRSTKAPHDLICRGYQVAGEASRPLPVWGLFTLVKMDAVTVLAFPDSEAPRPGYKMNDKAMLSIVAQLEVEPVA
jgi:hypothetical protein